MNEYMIATAIFLFGFSGLCLLAYIFISKLLKELNKINEMLKNISRRNQ